MTNDDDVTTIERLMDACAQGEDFFLVKGSWLDEFYRSSPETKQRMIDAPPSKAAQKGCKREALAYAASMAHKLANDFHLEVPKWVFERQYYLYDKPYFAWNARGNLRKLFLYVSPPEFKHRNLFVDDKALSRV